jgi:hypothetical protein
MHKKSLEAAKALKDDIDDPSDNNSCSGVTTDDDCSRPAHGTSLPNDSLPISRPSTASESCHSGHSAAPPGGSDKDEMRSESIALLRAKAQNYSAQVYLDGLHQLRQQQQQQQGGNEDLADRRRQYATSFGGSRSESATVAGGNADNEFMNEQLTTVDDSRVTSRPIDALAGNRARNGPLTNNSRHSAVEVGGDVFQ